MVMPGNNYSAYPNHWVFRHQDEVSADTIAPSSRLLTPGGFSAGCFGSSNYLFYFHSLYNLSPPVGVICYAMK